MSTDESSRGFTRHGRSNRRRALTLRVLLLVGLLAGPALAVPPEANQPPRQHAPEPLPLLLLGLGGLWLYRRDRTSRDRRRIELWL